MTSSRQKTLLLHGGALGDFILAWHFARRFCDDPASLLHVVARHRIANFFAWRGLVAQSRSDDSVGLHRLYVDSPERIEPLPAWLDQFDCVISFLAGSDSAVHRNLTGLCRGHVVSIDPRTDPLQKVHILDQWDRQVDIAYERRGHADFSVTAPPPVFADPERTQFRDTLRRRLNVDDDRPVMVIHPGSGGRSKCAPIDAFHRIRHEAADCGFAVAWMIGPDELERDGNALIDELKATAPMLIEPDIAGAADLLAGADAFVGNDSGMAHLAALLNLPTAVQFAATSPIVWRPVGRGVITVTGPDALNRQLVTQLKDTVCARCAPKSQLHVNS